jgi:arylsulfatase A-like enzyme
MNYRNWLTTGFVLLAATLAAVGGPPAAAAERPVPNIVFILADDLGWADVSTGRTNLGNGSDFYATPCVEVLARQGMAFTNAYTCGPNCAPTRAAIFTGQYGPRPTNNIFNVGDMNRTGRRKVPLVGTPEGLPTGEDEIPGAAWTVAEMLKTAGYATAHFGKYHVGGSLPDNGPRAQGFDFNFGGSTAGGPGAYHAQQAGDQWQFSRNIGPELDRYAAPYTQQYIDANIKPHNHAADIDRLVGTPKHVTDALADAAIDFMDISKQTPWFMHFAQYAVHSPVGDRQARTDLLAKYRDKATSQPSEMGDTKPSYAALIEGLDQAVARIVDHLRTTTDPRRPGHMLADNTLLIFTSDNGGKQPQANNGPLKGQKGELDEGGIRVPLVAWSPGLMNAAGSINATPVTSVDFFTTFADVAAAQLPADHVLDGVSLVPILRDPQTTLSRQAIFWHFPGYLLGSGRNARPRSVIRKGDYKLIYNYEDRSYALYNLAQDIGEVTNLLEEPLSAESRQVAADMSQQLIDWLTATSAPRPRTKGPDGQPADVVPLPSPF